MAEQGVVREVTVRLLAPLAVIQGQLRYDPADPYAVTLIMLAPGSVVGWTFGRNLLAAGMHATATGKVGRGDVQVWQRTTGVRRMLMLRLSTQDGMCVVALPRSTVGAFLGRTFHAVPRGTEEGRVDWDAVIKRLLEPRKPRPHGGAR